jgi:hypothetical protein
MTHTYAVLEIGAAAFAEIKAKLEAASYQHTFHEDDEHGTVIDMHGIALAELKLTSFVNCSKKRAGWSEEDCRLFVNAALCSLIENAGGTMIIPVSELLRSAPGGVLAMSLSDDDKFLTLTRVKQDT